MSDYMGILFFPRRVHPFNGQPGNNGNKHRRPAPQSRKAPDLDITAQTVNDVAKQYPAFLFCQRFGHPEAVYRTYQEYIFIGKINHTGICQIPDRHTFQGIFQTTAIQNRRISYLFHQLLRFCENIPAITGHQIQVRSA